jgi:hypothetical protein
VGCRAPGAVKWREHPEKRRPDDLPWYRTSARCAATVALLGVIAYVRAVRAGAEFAALRDLQRKP